MQQSLSDHITRYIGDRRTIRRNEKYVRELELKLTKLVKECAWSRVGQVSAESFVRWRSKQKKHPKTLNEYLNAISGLMKWLDAVIPHNPLRGVKKVETSGAAKRERRAFTRDEMRELLAVSGERGHIYTVAAHTGLRRGELGKLEWRDVHLNAPLPYIDVRASISKNHRQSEVPLTGEALAALRCLVRAGARPTDLVLKRLIPRMNRFREDLVAAGIPYVNAKGEVADFHALRKTFGTWLMMAGVSEFVRMKAMRHSDMRLTQSVYTDARMAPMRDAIASLPSIRDTQIDTHVSVSDGLSLSAPVPSGKDQSVLLAAGDQTFSPSESASVRESLKEADGARCRVRTCDFLRVKQALYH
jgi:integrase